jgi:phage shock protein E
MNWMMKSSLILPCVLACTATLASDKPEHTKVPLETVKAEVQQKKAILVDVREKREWDRGHIKGAVFLPLSEIQEGIDPQKLSHILPKDKIIYAHCARGGRCLTAAVLLEKAGYQIRALKPGYQQLIQAGFEKAKK